MAVTILDGTRLAAQRAPAIAGSAADVLLRRGHPPTLLLMAFAGAGGHVPHVNGKLRASRELGIRTLLLPVAPDQSTGDALAALRHATGEHALDAVFVQVPFPDGLDGDALSSAIPPQLDVDVMSPARVASYMDSADALPPVTVSAALTLLDAHGIQVAGRSGVLVADDSAFAHMFREALLRRGASAADLARPSDADLHQQLRGAALVVAAAGIPALLRSSQLAPGCVALDIGYFNGGGRGDIELDAIHHLDAVMPVPGGVGPMTISALMERVVDFAR